MTPPPPKYARRLAFLDAQVRRCTGCGVWLWQALCCAYCARRALQDAR